MEDYHIFDEETERLLLDNDRSVTHLRFFSSDRSLGAPSRLGTALQGNSRVSRLQLNLNRSEQGDDFTGTIQFIEESPSLKSLNVNFGFARLVGQLIQAATRNPSAIETIELWHNGILVHDYASLLQAASSVSYLALGRCELLRGGMPSDAAAVQLITEAFASNTSLQRLDLDWSATNGQFLLGILQALQGHSKLQHLLIGSMTFYNDRDAASAALVELLSSATCPLEALTFRYCHWGGTSSFAAIAGCLQSSAMVKSITFESCDFDEESSLRLVSIFQSNGSATELVLEDRLTFAEGTKVLSTKVLGSLVESSRHLSVLDTNKCVLNSNELGAIIMGLKAKTSKVEAVFFPRLSPAECELLIESVPAFRCLKKLECILEEDSAHLKGKLLTAFYHNGSIIDSNGVSVSAPFLNEIDRAKLRLYALRNKMLAPMIESATADSSEINLVPSLFWHSLIATGAAGPNGVFCALVRLGDRIGSTTNNNAERHRVSSNNCTQME